MDTLLEHLKKCRDLLGLEKSVATATVTPPPSISPANVGTKNIVYKQKTGHTSFMPKKTTMPKTKVGLPEIKPPPVPGLKQTRLGDNKQSLSEV